MPASCATCAGEAAFQLVPGMWPDVGWAHWAPPAVALGVRNDLLRMPWSAERAVQAWNSAQGRFYLDLHDQSLPTVELRDYGASDLSDLSGPVQDYPDAAFWGRVGGAALLWNAAGGRVSVGAADRRTAKARLWLNYNGLGAPASPTADDQWADLSRGQQEAVDALVHEIGHALGLGDVRNDPGWRVMDYSDLYSPGPSGPYPSDVVSVLYAYGGLDWWPKAEEWLAGLPPGVLLWLWDHACGQWLKWDSSARPYSNTLRALRPGDRLQCFSETRAAVQVGRHLVEIAPGATTLTWPPP